MRPLLVVQFWLTAVVATNGHHQTQPSKTSKAIKFCCLTFYSTIFDTLTVPLTIEPDLNLTEGIVPIYDQCELYIRNYHDCKADIDPELTDKSCGDVTPDFNKNWTGTCNSLEDCVPKQNKCLDGSTWTLETGPPPAYHPGTSKGSDGVSESDNSPEVEKEGTSHEKHHGHPHHPQKHHGHSGHH